MQLYLATQNTNKIKEITEFLQLHSLILSKPDLVQKSQKSYFFIKSLKDLKSYKTPEETGHSFRENARLKSHSLFQYLKKQEDLKYPLGIFGEDSGLELEVLGGKPGIFSARYSGKYATDQENNQFLLKNLEAKKNRKACYVCALFFLYVEKNKMTEHFFTGKCGGTIAHQEIGQLGFAYDSLFVPQGETKTFGELPKKFKQNLSHRSMALKKWKKYLENL